MESIVLSDIVGQSDLVSALRNAITQAVTTRLAAIWAAQNPGKPQPSAYDALTITLDHTTVATIIEDAASNATMSIGELDVDRAQLARMVES